ncbi:MAG: helix-turn-helix transcriptional regulator [Bacteroidales bacterium]|nr:helix-turn-helix transcriptional regulator [Bacteroidales bacterium]
MIDQPNLGRRLIELRKHRGFTQEEFSAKCNISIRTLQRIESGEGIPRSYTLKLILDTLCCKEADLIGLSTNATGIKSPWFERIYRNFLNLFYLGTNTKRKITILLIIISVIVVGIFFINPNIKHQNKYLLQQKRENKDSTEQNLYYSDFTCLGCMDEKGLTIGRDVNFTLNGVKVTNIRLIALDRKKRELQRLVYKRKIFDKKGYC